MNISLTRKSAYDWWLVLALVIGVYLLLNLALPRIPDSTLETYVARPILWGLLAWAILVLPRHRPTTKLSVKSSLIQLALFIGLFQVAILLIGGLFSSFGKSPHAFTAASIAIHLIYVVSMLVGMELSRAWLINRLGGHHTFLAIAFLTLLYSLFPLRLDVIMNPGEQMQTVRFANERVLPLLSENLLATFLAFLGGALPAIAYRGVLQAFNWFCPVLPDLPWAFKGLIGTAVPIMGLVAAGIFYSAQTGRHRPKWRAKEGFPAGWVITAIIAVVIVWFAVGLFPFHPVLVAGGSMRPTMNNGDIAIVMETPADVIKEGDIIQFRKGERATVVHRVVDIQEKEGKIFITKGDANNKPDVDPVFPRNVGGKVVFNIPRIGWVAIMVKQFFTG